MNRLEKRCCEYDMAQWKLHQGLVSRASTVLLLLPSGLVRKPAQFSLLANEETLETRLNHDQRWKNTV